MFGALKNTLVKFQNISNDKVVNIINNLLGKFQKSFTSANIVKSFEKAGITHQTIGNSFERKSYFMVDTSKIDEDKREIMEIESNNLTFQQMNNSVKMKLNKR